MVKSPPYLESTIAMFTRSMPRRGTEADVRTNIRIRRGFSESLSSRYGYRLFKLFIMAGCTSDNASLSVQAVPSESAKLVKSAESQVVHADLHSDALDREMGLSIYVPRVTTRTTRGVSIPCCICYTGMEETGMPGLITCVFTRLPTG